MPTTGAGQPHAAAGPAFTDALTNDIAVRMTARGPRTPPCTPGRTPTGPTSPSESAGR